MQGKRACKAAFRFGVSLKPFSSVGWVERSETHLGVFQIAMLLHALHDMISSFEIAILQRFPVDSKSAHVSRCRRHGLDRSRIHNRATISPKTPRRGPRCRRSTRTMTIAKLSRFAPIAATKAGA
jgi:hypothetical protein